MTIAVGIAPTDGSGCVLVTDSMSHELGASGAVRRVLLNAEGRSGYLAGSRLAFVRAGHFCPGPLPALPGDGDFEERARALHAALTAQAPAAGPVPRILGVDGLPETDQRVLSRWGGQDVVICDAPYAASGPRLAVFKPERPYQPDRRYAERWIEGAAVVVAGAPTEWAGDRGLDQQAPPPDLAAALTMATEIAAGFIAYAYGGLTLEQLMGLGQVPTVGYPLNAWLVTQNSVTTLMRPDTTANWRTTQ